MGKCIIYSIVIYLIFMMSIVLHKPQILCDHNGDFKSITYLQDHLQNSINDPQELISLPVIMILGSIISYLLARNLSQS